MNKLTPAPSPDTKRFLHSAMALTIPVAMQNLIMTAINSLDVIMLGRVGESVLSGASLGNQIYFVMTLFLFGVTSGASVLIAQYWGRKNTRAIATVFGIGMKLGLAISGVFTVAAFAVPASLMAIFTREPEVIAEGMRYLRLVCFSYPFTAFNMVYLNTMRSMERVKIATAAYTCAFVVNLAANSVLIFGLLGMPAMGAAGAALGTVIARMAETAVVLVYDRKVNDTLKFRVKFLVIRNPALFRDFVRYASPVIANELLWGLGVSTITGILGHLGKTAVAANAVAQVARQLSMIVAFGVSAAATIEIGKKIGAGDVAGAKDYGKKYALLSVATGALGAVVILIARPLALHFMTLTEQAASYLSSMMFVLSYFVVGQSINSTFIVGIFRAGGDTRFGFFFDMAFLWGCAILGGWIAAFVCHAPVMVVYVILMSDEILKLPVAFARYKSYKWLRNITRD